jgi:hypothetical protein
MTDFRILSQPRISVDTFAAILKANGSPAAPVGPIAYRSILQRGVDPALALAVFQHESSFGKKGAAHPRRNWGNLRTSPRFPDDGRFVVYPSWNAGAGDAARLLAIYGRNRIRKGKTTDSARTFPFVWAPAKDHNKPAAYGDAIVGAIQKYLKMERQRHPDGIVRTTHAASGGHAAVAPLPGGTRFVALADHVRIRERPSTQASIVRTVRTGAIGIASATVTGSKYVAFGQHGTTWIRIVALGSHTLPEPVFSAALLWRTD